MGSGVVTPRASGQVDFAVRNGGDVPMYDGFRAPSSGNYFWSSNGPTVRMLTARRWGQLSSPARKNADALFIEAPFAKADATFAAKRAHLTTSVRGYRKKWQRRCHKLALRESKNPDQYLTKEQQEACLDSAAAELIREIRQRRLLN